MSDCRWKDFLLNFKNLRDVHVVPYWCLCKDNYWCKDKKFCRHMIIRNYRYADRRKISEFISDNIYSVTELLDYICHVSGIMCSTQPNAHFWIRRQLCFKASFAIDVLFGLGRRMLIRRLMENTEMERYFFLHPGGEFSVTEKNAEYYNCYLPLTMHFSFGKVNIFDNDKSVYIKDLCSYHPCISKILELLFM